MRSLPLLSALTLALAACGSDSKPPVPPPPADQATAPPPTGTPAPAAGPVESATYAAGLKVDLKNSTRLPSGVYFRDITIGTGTAVAAGQQVSVHYVASLADGKIVDQNGPKDQPYMFTLGAGRVIRGWDEGVVGMKAGGTRQLIVPPELAYGPGGSGPVPPNAVMVFTVDLPSAR